MGLDLFCKRIAIIAIALASLWAAPTLAQSHLGQSQYADSKPNSLAPTCHAATGLKTDIAEMAKRALSPERPGWTCSNTDWIAHEPAAWLLFEKAAWSGDGPPRYFFSRIARHASITFAALDTDGTVRVVRWSEADAEPVPMGPIFRHALPPLSKETRALIVRIELPHSVPLLTDARLVYQPEDAGWSEFEVIIVAFVLGMLVLPLFFDISFFIVLRERFVLLHAVMVLAMMGYVLSAGGLISIFPYFSLRTIAVAGPLLWAIGVGTSALFLAEFLEDGAQSPFMKRLTLAIGAWCIAVPGVFAFQLHQTQSFDDRGYFYAFLPVIVVISVAVVEALIRGSRSARFIAVAWAPIILASIDRLLRGMGVYTGPSSFDLTMYVATGVEVVIISLAIADRFLAIRRERDAAVLEAKMLEQISTRDPLTGLLNRRGLEARFGALIKEGFDTFALIDLDRFKQVNDRHGHQAGDAALVACATALVGGPSRDLVAARLGGEEFVLMLRGKRALERAEALRKAIPVRIARDVEGLDAPVTASSGAIEVPRASNALMTFDALYARADALMYEAKASGRNRMLYEKLTVFDEPPSQRPDTERREYRHGGSGGGAPKRVA
ncbi:MAG: diguanylate cyclase [Pseudomonadota bacterium]